MSIEVLPYNPQWPLEFEAEKTRLEAALQGQTVTIHHVGSTSVPGMVAKPIIDILLIAEDRDATIASLTEAGYAFKGEWNIPLKCGFTKRGGNLHAFFTEDHPEVALNLMFRDFLRSHPEQREAYGRLKQEILKDPHAQERVGKIGLPNYTKRKRAFIDSLLQEAGFDKPRLLRALTEEEFAEAKRFRAQFFEKTGQTDPLQGQPLEGQHDEHLILYKGVAIAGYAHVHFEPRSRQATLCVFELTPEGEPWRSFYRKTIQTWVQVHLYALKEVLG